MVLAIVREHQLTVLSRHLAYLLTKNNLIVINANFYALEYALHLRLLFERAFYIETIST